MKNLKRKLSILLIVTLLFTTLLTGCSGGEETDKVVDKENEVNDVQEDEASDDTESDDEQVLKISLGTEPDSLDVAKASDAYSLQVVEQATETLTRIETDENGDTVIAPAAAEEWKVSEDGLEWTFQLRDAEWADGEPLTAHDFEYGMKRVIDPETASPISTLLKHLKNAEEAIEGNIDVDEVGVEAIDDKTLKITLEYPVPYFLHLTAGREMQPQRKDIIEELGNVYGSEAEHTISCGPFIIEEWVHNSEVILTKNENYWDKDSVKLDKIVMKIISEPTALMGEFKNEEVDFVSANSAEWIEELEAEDKYTRITKLIPRTSYLFFNQEHELFSNAKIRQAFSIALDREEIQTDISQDLTRAAYGWIAPPIECDGVNFREAVGDPIKDLIEENPDPQALLVEGLEELGMDPDPSKVTVTIMQPDTAGKEFGEYLQQTFTQVLGINIELDSTEWPVFQERNRQLDYEMGYKSWGGGVSDPTSFLDLWMTGNKIVPIGWANEEYDNLVKEASLSLDTDERIEKFAEAERILVKDECSIAPFEYLTTNTFIQPYVKGLMLPDFGSVVLKYAYIDKSGN